MERLDAERLDAARLDALPPDAARFAFGLVVERLRAPPVDFEPPDLVAILKLLTSGCGGQA